MLYRDQTLTWYAVKFQSVFIGCLGWNIVMLETDEKILYGIMHGLAHLK